MDTIVFQRLARQYVVKAPQHIWTKLELNADDRLVWVRGITAAYSYQFGEGGAQLLALTILHQQNIISFFKTRFHNSVYGELCFKVRQHRHRASTLTDAQLNCYLAVQPPRPPEPEAPAPLRFTPPAAEPFIRSAQIALEDDAQPLNTINFRSKEYAYKLLRHMSTGEYREGFASDIIESAMLSNAYLAESPYWTDAKASQKHLIPRYCTTGRGFRWLSRMAHALTATDELVSIELVRYEAHQTLTFSGYALPPLPDTPYFVRYIPDPAERLAIARQEIARGEVRQDVVFSLLATFSADQQEAFHAASHGHPVPAVALDFARALGLVEPDSNRLTFTGVKFAAALN